MATKSTRNLSFQEAQAMWPGVTLDPNESMTFEVTPNKPYATGGIIPPETFAGLHDQLARGQEFASKRVPPAERRVDPNNATRFDDGKVDWSLVPFEALEGMVKVLEFGAKKYSRGNWKSGNGFSYLRVLNSCFRHLFSYLRGEDLDPESGLSHIHHAQCNLLFIAYYLTNKTKYNKDDRGE